MRGQPLVMRWNWGQVQRKINSKTNEKKVSHIIHEKRKNLQNFHWDYRFFRQVKNPLILRGIFNVNYYYHHQIIENNWSHQVLVNRENQILDKRLFLNKVIFQRRRKNLIFRNHQFLKNCSKQMNFYFLFARGRDNLCKKRK